MNPSSNFAIRVWVVIGLLAMLPIITPPFVVGLGLIQLLVGERKLGRRKGVAMAAAH